MTGKLLLGGWLIVVMLGLATLSLGHIAAMPGPEARLAREALALRPAPGRSLFVHVISAGCTCTERLFSHLTQRARFQGADEVVLFVGDDEAKRGAAERAGLGFVTTSAAELSSRFGVDAAPLLIAFDAAGRLSYLGGYYNHPSTLFPLDETIQTQLAQGAAPKPLPVFGCAVSAQLQKSVDPLGIVYR
jgi:thioredoxin-related protein